MKSALEETEKKLERSGGAITEKVNISGFSKFGVHMLKKTGNKYLKEAKLENKKNMMISESIMQDKIDELKKLRQNIDQLSPKTVSSHGSDLADMPEVDYNDMESYKKAQEILMKKAKERELKKQKIEEEKRKNQMLEGM